MKLKTKLMMTFCAMVLVPLVLGYFCVMIFTRYQVQTLGKTFNIEGSVDMFIGSSIQMFSTMVLPLQNELELQIQEEPDSFLDIEMNQQFNKELNDRYSYLIIRRESEIYYNGMEQNLGNLLSKLPEYTNDGQEWIGSYIGNGINALINQRDVVFSDGRTGSIFIVTDINILIASMRQIFGELLITIIFILVMIAFMLTMWTYRTLLQPLSELQKAAKEIKDGNLDYELLVDDKDELGQICMDFEEMRQRLKANADEKIQYDKENKELISNISHDLKTPLTAIKGYVEGIMDGVASSPEMLERYIQTIYNKVNDMDMLIDELTFYTKIDTNKIPYNFSRINVNEYFEDCISEIGLELEAKNIELRSNTQLSRKVEIIADVEQLKRVINNIVSNSVKYMGTRKGIIEIRLLDVGDFVQVEIEDNGKGIGAKELPYIFERFYRADSSRNSAQGGSGIGLSIVRKIIDDHGGKIWATSKMDEGTTMHFVLRKYQEVSNE